MIKIACALLVLASGAALADDLDQTHYDAAASAIVGVRSTCPGGDRAGQGFLITGGNVVTARHVIAGCSSFQVDFYSHEDHAAKSGTVRAKVSRSLKRADLALLSLAEVAPDGVTPVMWSHVAPAGGTAVWTVARHLDATGIKAEPTHVEFGSSKLSTMVNGMADVEAELTQVGSPALDLDIVNLSDILTRGMSGSPIVGSDGVVVAITDGGLKGGLAGVNWAVPAQLIDLLQASNEPKPTVAEAAPSHALFSEELSPDQVQTIACGHFKLIKTKTLSYSQAAQVADDPAGLQYLLSQALMDPQTARFEVYEHLPTGAVIVAPAGIKFQSMHGACIASYPGTPMQFKLRIETADTPEEIQEKTSMFETGLLGHLMWQPLPGYTYVAPVTRYDGLTVRRKMAAAFAPPSPAIQALLFETLAAHGHVVFGWAVIQDTSGIDMNSLMLQCPALSTQGPCADYNARRRAWGASVLAIHMSTFSRGNETAGESEENDDSSPDETE